MTLTHARGKESEKIDETSARQAQPDEKYRGGGPAKRTDIIDWIYQGIRSVDDIPGKKGDGEHE